MVNEVSAQHPHEPLIPPTINEEGSCLICAVNAERDALRVRLGTAEELLRRVTDLANDGQSVIESEFTFPGDDPAVKWAGDRALLVKCRAFLSDGAP